MINSFQFLCVITLLLKSDASRILGVFPIPSISHQVVFRQLMLELAKQGHEVVVITPDPAYPKGESPKNFTEIDVHDISYEHWNGFVEAKQGDKDNLREQIKVAFELILNIVELQINTPEVQDLINNKGKYFDLLIIEACVRPALAYSYLFQLPVIQFSSFGGFVGNFETVGAYVHPLIYPIACRQKLHNLTFWERISEMHTYFSIENLFNGLETPENKRLKKMFGPMIPDLNELRKNVHMLFINNYQIWDANRPVPPNVIYLGGLHLTPEKKLPKELKSHLDSSTHGVIYMSFGTNVRPSLLPPEKIKIFSKVFSQLPYDVVWKWDKDVLPGQSNNTRIFKWLPQQDLLRHPNIKLFITQGGLQSTDEAINAGVPLIGVPMLGDQWYNVEQYVYYKIGKQIAINTLTEDDLKLAIESVINDKSYKENIIKVRKIMNDQPQTALERAVWWTEYVLRHKGSLHLRAPTANISLSELYQLDIVFTILSFIIIILILIVFAIRHIFKRNFTKVKLQ